MTTWISSTPFTNEEAKWIIETVKVIRIYIEPAKTEEVRDLAGNSYSVCVMPSLIYLETASEQQDTMLLLKFGNKLEPIEVISQYERIL